MDRTQATLRNAQSLVSVWRGSATGGEGQGSDQSIQYTLESGNLAAVSNIVNRNQILQFKSEIKNSIGYKTKNLFPRNIFSPRQRCLRPDAGKVECLLASEDCSRAALQDPVWFREMSDRRRCSRQTRNSLGSTRRIPHTAQRRDKVWSQHNCINTVQRNRRF